MTEDTPAPAEEPASLIDPSHPCQTPHRSYPRHYWVGNRGPNGELDLISRRCTTCGVVEKAPPRWEGQ
jgi:hypothetical protein